MDVGDRYLRGPSLENPEFDKAERVHDWRNYVGEHTRALWHTLTPEQRQAIALDADILAGGEEWE